MKKALFLQVAACCFSLGAVAQDSKKWNVAEPSGNFNYKEISFTTDEGTWMNLDVSPDGKTIVFDMVGDIYTMPITGGKATALRTGIPYELQPRFSPNGEWISFTSDAAGGDNIWIMKKDGSGAKQITKEAFRLLNNAVWSADGNYLIGRKHFTSQRSLGAGEMWMYHLTGGDGLQLTKKKNDQQDVNEPCVSTDGKYLYYSEDVYPGGFFQYNKDPNNQIYVIQRYDFEKGTTEGVTGGRGGAARPQISKDGKKLAFVRRVDTKSVLFIRDIETGEEYPIYDKLNKDQQEAWAIFGVYPNFNWLPDNEHIIFWAGGKIHKININSLVVTNIPFSVEAKIKVAETLKFKNQVAPANFTAKMIRHLVTAPNGQYVVFNAVGYLWKKQLPNGTPERLTSSTEVESEPAFSPDGKELAYVTWDDEKTGAIYTLDLSTAGAKPNKISSTKGIYRTPSYSNDGTKIVFNKEGGNGDLGYNFCEDAGLYWISNKGGKMNLIIKEGEYPQFNLSGDRIYYQSGGTFFGALTKDLKSCDLTGKEVKTHLKSKYANRIIVSPDNKWVAFTNLHKGYLAAMPAFGQTLEVDGSTKAVPVSQFTKDAGINVHWSSDSKKIYWTLGEEYFSNDIAKRFTFLEGSLDSVPPMDTTGIKINLVVPFDQPKGVLALKGAKIITMEGDEVINNGVIIIRGNKIEAIGSAGKVTIPKEAKVIDVTGKTIMPGIVDVHAHVGGFRAGLLPQKHWQFYANLAYGVTTSHDPSALNETIFGLSELVKAGRMVGQRTFSTGTILYGADGDFKAVINSIDDARSAIKRTVAFGAFSVKSYNQPRREQRQQVIQAARELNVQVVPEGGSTFFHNMTMVIDGHTGIEHNIPVAPVYKDIIQLWSSSKTGYTPTLIVNYGGMNGENYWYQKTNVWENKTLLKYHPHSIITTRSRHRTMIPDEEYENGHILVSKTAKKLSDAGVKVNLGAHGQLQGLGAHWELWMLAQGGMSNLEAIRAATLNGANYLGMEDEIGSLKAGKLADLIILDKDPLQNIQNTNSVKYTMVNGRLYDVETMNEIGLEEKKRSKFYWEQLSKNAAFQWSGATLNNGHSGCSCRH